MSTAYGTTLTTDLHGLSAERIAFLAGTMDEALQLPFLYAVVKAVLSVEFSPIEAPGPHRRKTTEGASPNPRKLKKGQQVTYTKVNLENSVALSRLAQLGGVVNELELLQALGKSAGWGIHQEVIDWLMNNAFTVNWADGVPFFSASHPSETGLQSNRLESALDGTAITSALVMLNKQRGHDGQYVGQAGGILLVPADLGPVAWQLVQPTGQTLPTAGAGVVQGPSYIGAQGLSVAVSPAIEDTDGWAMLGRNFRVEAFVADPSAPKVEPIVGTRDRLASDELTFTFGARSWRGAIGCGPA